ncbi:MAG: AAA family ATPase [Acetatifactor sp.]|nr:AAA family ATPase [Acetatifactor sp.]
MKFLMIPIFAVLAVCLVFYLDCMFWYLLRFFRGDRIQSGSVQKLPKRSALLRIFYDAPRQYVSDIYDRKPDFFRPQGLVIFTGRQGNGKSIAMMQYALELHDTYPLCRILSNTAFAYQNQPLRHWKQLVDYQNEHYGVIAIIDELQNWFSSNQSRNFPPEMLSVITQNRKNRRLILGTSQNFYLLAKPIRSQCTEIRQCMTLAGVLTIVIKREPIVDNDGDVKEMKYRGMYFFVHNPRLRDSYDTWAVVENLKESGFHDNPMIKDGQVVTDNM